MNSTNTMIAEIMQLTSLDNDGLNLIFRPLHYEDFGGINTLCDKCQYPNANISINDINNSSCVVFGAFDGSVLVGFLSIDWKEALIKNLLVDFGYRDKGIEGKLIRMAEEEVKNHGVNIVKLHARVYDRYKLPIYQTLGYKIKSFNPGYYKENPGDAFLLEKTL